MAQKFRTGSLVQVRGNMYPVLIVKAYDSSLEIYTCAAGTLASSYKMLAKESLMSQCPEGTVAPKSIPTKAK